MLEWEQEKWKDITPGMMSDEEEDGDDTFRVHRQEWRSEEITALFEELDRRADAVMKRAHPRKTRVIGTPLKVGAPSATKEWMVKDSGTQSRDGSPELIN